MGTLFMVPGMTHLAAPIDRSVRHADGHPELGGRSKAPDSTLPGRAFRMVRVHCALSAGGTLLKARIPMMQQVSPAVDAAQRETRG